MNVIKIEIGPGDIFLNKNANQANGQKAVIVVGFKEVGDKPILRVKDLLAPSMINGEQQPEEGFEIDAFTLARAGEKISKATLAQLMYDYHVRQHLDLAKNACDNADKAPRYKYKNAKEILAEMDMVGRILNEEQNDEEYRAMLDGFGAMLDGFDIKGNTENEEKFLTLTIKSLIDAKQWDIPLAEFLLSIQKPMYDTAKSK